MFHIASLLISTGNSPSKWFWNFRTKLLCRRENKRTSQSAKIYGLCLLFPELNRRMSGWCLFKGGNCIRIARTSSLLGRVKFARKLEIISSIFPKERRYFLKGYVVHIMYTKAKLVDSSSSYAVAEAEEFGQVDVFNNWVDNSFVWAKSVIVSNRTRWSSRLFEFVQPCNHFRSLDQWHWFVSGWRSF